MNRNKVTLKNIHYVSVSSIQFNELILALKWPYSKTAARSLLGLYWDVIGGLLCNYSSFIGSLLVGYWVIGGVIGSLLWAYWVIIGGLLSHHCGLIGSLSGGY